MVVVLVELVLVVDVEVDEVLVDSVGGGPIGTRSGGSAGSMNVVVVVSISVVDVDVLDEVVVEFDGAIGAVVDGGGMHVDVGLDDAVGSVVGGAAAASDAKPAITATPRTASRTSGAARPPGIRRWAARAQAPTTIARAPMSSVAPTEPPESGRLHTRSMALGGRCRERDGTDHNVAGHTAAAELQRVRNLCVGHCRRLFGPATLLEATAAGVDSR